MKFIYSLSKKHFTKSFQANFYEVLRIDKFSSIETVKLAYTKILENHSEEEDKDLMYIVNLAFETLTDPNSKEDYDMYMKNDPAFDNWEYKDNIYCKESSRQDFENKNSSESQHKDNMKFYRNKFHDMNYKQEKKTDIDLNYNLEIKLNELFSNTENELNEENHNLCQAKKESIVIDKPRFHYCLSCNGKQTKSHNKNNSLVCHSCRGTNSKCKLCNGSGYVIKDPCLTCKGTGIQLQKSFELKVVKKDLVLSNNQIIKFPKEGNIESISKSGEIRGDLYLQIKILNQNQYNEIIINKFDELDSKSTIHNKFYASISNSDLTLTYSVDLKDIISSKNLKLSVPLIGKGFIIKEIQSEDLISNKIILKGLGFKKKGIDVDENKKDLNSFYYSSNSNNNKEIYGDIILKCNVNIPNGFVLNKEYQEDLTRLLDKYQNI